jgi:hypothetical protein
MAAAAPALSFVVVADRFRYIADVVAALRRLPEQDRIELVVGVPDERGLELDESAVEGLDVRVVETGPALLAEARALAAHAASAPYVFIGETHCYPQPGWSRAILAAHAEGWDTVVPVMANGNPESAVSCAAFLLAYGRNAEPVPPLELAASPTYNTSMRRDLVAEHFDGGQGFVDVPLRDGQRVFRVPGARMTHVNVSGVRVYLKERFLVGRLYAADRARGWSPARRAGYVLGAPLLPVAQLARVVRRTGLRRYRRLPPLTLPAMAAGVVASAAGEAVSYAGKPTPRSLRLQIDELEVHRIDYAGRG